MQALRGRSVGEVDSNIDDSKTFLFISSLCGIMRRIT